MLKLVDYSDESSNDDQFSTELTADNVEKAGGQSNDYISATGLLPATNAGLADAASFTVGYNNQRKRLANNSAEVRGKKKKGDPWADSEDSDENEEQNGYEQQSDPGDKLSNAADDDGEDNAEPILPREAAAKSVNKLEHSEFLGSQWRDYLGRTYMHIPRDLNVNLHGAPGTIAFKPPKKHVYSYSGHSKGVTCMELFPGSGHLLLSGGNDNEIKLWDVYHDREHLRTYSGHNRTIKSVAFNSTGTQFVSSSFDRYIKVWDTETGQCVNRRDMKSTPNAVKIHPEKPNEALIALSNAKIEQIDLRSNDIIQTYDYHQQAVNSVTFVDENLRFMSTSDDRSVRVWEYGINIPIKTISDPSSVSMPSMKLHPSGKYVAAVALNNTIAVIAASDQFQQVRRKNLTGLNSTGYPVGLDFSSDGQYVMSGDSNGSACFWHWNSKRMTKIRAHRGPTVCIACHPHERSMVFTGGLDGGLKVWR